MGNSDGIDLVVSVFLGQFAWYFFFKDRPCGNHDVFLILNLVFYIRYNWNLTKGLKNCFAFALAMFTNLHIIYFGYSY